MIKNAPNELKFGPNMYFYEFYQIAEVFWKFFKISWFLPKKRSFSAFFASRFWNFFFDGNHIRAFKNAQIWLKISILVAYYVFNKTVYGFWVILNFGDFMDLHSCRDGYIRSFSAHFVYKIRPLGNFEGPSLSCQNSKLPKNHT